MSKRQRLRNAVRVMFTALIAGFTYVLFSSLSTDNEGVEQTNEAVQNSFTDVNPGQTTIRRLNGQRVWLTRLSDNQRHQAISLTAYVRDMGSGCNPQQNYCAVIAMTAQFGIELSFTEDAPPQLGNGVPWFGGFVNPTNGAVYDRLGRAYTSSEHSKTPLGANLKVVDVK